MSELKAFIEEMAAKYSDAVEILPAKDSVNLSQIPQPLAEFYSLYDRVWFPFGHIDSPEISVEDSAVAEPFRSERAFCFGGDTDGICFWLCALDGPDEDGFVFTSWDHDVDGEIEYAFGDLTGLLRYAEKDYLEFMEFMSNQSE